MSDAVAERAGDPFAGTSYKNLRRLGTGGMGEVYLVEHRHLGRTFVAKILRPELAPHPQVIDRMRLEAQALGQLNHPNIVSVFGFATSEDRRPFIVLEHLEGRTLREELDLRGALPADEAVRYALAVLSGLGAAHSLGIVHRDVKPDNLFLAIQANGDRVAKVLDFGIARVLPDASERAPRPLALPTESGAVIGTPRYLSPEAARGGRVDARADLYCVALVLYTMLAGRGPFDHAADADELRKAHASETPAPPSRYASEPLPPALDELVLTALAKDPAARYQSAAAFSVALEQVARENGIPLAAPVATTSAILSPRPSEPPLAPAASRTEPLPRPPGAAVPVPAPGAADALLRSSRGAAIHPATAAAEPTPKRAISALRLALLFALSAVLSGLAAAGLVEALFTGR